MKCKYKKFLKAAYINYEEDYCGRRSGTFTKPTVTTPIIVITGATAIIACAISGATIYYTLDGSTPTSSSTEYTGAITLTLSCTVKAIAVKPGMSDSAVASERYVHYLTQWKIVGNSEVHTDPYLTSWKVSGNSEVHTLPYPDGVVLPTGYKRCEYLTFDGNSYINTGIKTANDIGYDLRCKVKQNDLLIGARFNTTAAGFTTGFFQANSVAVSYGGTTATSFSTTSSYINSVCHIILDSVKFQIDDEVLDISSLRGTTTMYFFDIYLGTWNNNGTPDNRMWNSDIYDTIIYNTQGELWHGIPCLDANDVPCFYDIVSQTAFYNQGSGSFTYKLYPQPTEILSCGDLGQDGKYHVKISNGAAIYDIPLDAPLCKVNDVADSIEFPSDTEGKALVTRNLGCDRLGNFTWSASTTSNSPLKRWNTKSLQTVIKASSVILTIEYTKGSTWGRYDKTYSYDFYDFFIYDEDYNTEDSYNDFIAHINNYDIIYELATPTTELVDAPQIAASLTNTYTSANVVSYSAFEHTENKEIWSCGEYNATDGKYHILVQPLGGSIVDIALTEPLRKVEEIADTIEFPSDTKALVTRNIGYYKVTSNSNIVKDVRGDGNYRWGLYDLKNMIKTGNTNILCSHYPSVITGGTYNANYSCIAAANSGAIIYDTNYNEVDNIKDFKDYVINAGVEIIYVLVTPITELVDAPQIAEAESYTCVISQGGKAVSWSSFEI